MSSLYSVERGRKCHAAASRAEPWTERVQSNHSTLFVILFVTTGTFLLVLVTLVYFLFTGQNEEARNVLSPFVVLLFFIVWTMMTRLGRRDDQ